MTDMTRTYVSVYYLCILYHSVSHVSHVSHGRRVMP